MFPSEHRSINFKKFRLKNSWFLFLKKNYDLINYLNFIGDHIQNLTIFY